MNGIGYDLAKLSIFRRSKVANVAVNITICKILVIEVIKVRVVGIMASCAKKGRGMGVSV